MTIRALILILLLTPVAFSADDGIELEMTATGSILGGSGANLTWTGGSPQYEVRRSADPNTLGAISSLQSLTYGQQWNDFQVGTGDLVFYNVVSRSNCFDATADAYVSAFYPNDNFGNEDALELDGSPTKISYVQFPVRDALPPRAVINSATLRMGELYATDDSEIQVRRVGEPWSEDTITFNNRPFTTANYGIVLHTGNPDWRTWNVTNLVRDWIGGTQPTFGIELYPYGEDDFVGYAAREDVPPQLCIDWESPFNDAWFQLQAASATPPTIESENGVMLSLTADVSVVRFDPVSAALAFLDSYKALFALDDVWAQTWLDRIVTDDVGITSVTFGLRKDGIRYRSDRVSVRIAPGTPPFVPYRVVSASNWHRDHGFEQNTDIVVTEQIARLIADAEFGETGVRILGEPYLQWHNPNPWIEQTDPHRPVWRVAAQVQDAGSGVWNDWLIHIDAEDGSIESNTVTDETVGDRPGEEIRVYSVNLTREGNCWDDSPNRDLWFTTLGFTTEYANLPAGSDTFADGIDAWNGYHGTYHYFYDVFSRESMDGSGVLLETLVDVASRTGNADWNNASFNRNCNHMRFGDGWAVPDIIAHEFTHGVDRFSNQLIYANQSGALDESYADYFAAMVDGNWTIGEAREDGTRNPIRDMSNPPMRGDPDHRDPARSGDGTGLRPAVAVPAGGTGGNDWGAVHTNSGIPNKVGFLITDGGQHNGLTIAGLEQAKAERLQYMVFTTKLTSSSNFQHARDMTVEHAQTYVSGGHHDFTSLDVCDVINAWASVGYGDPDLDCNGVVDSPGGDADFDGIPNDRDNCPLARNIGQRDLDGDLTGDDCDPDVDGDLFFDTEDNCPRTANPNQADTDADGFGDLCDDDDGDGVLDLNDNCPLTPNEDQRDRDGDSQGDVCDNDADNDGLDNNVDNCPLDANASQYDPDSDGVGFQCDNCQFDPNPGQENLDGDGQGDVCDSDDDGDDFEDGSDNCPLYYNPRQIDNDGNGTGLYCDAGEKFQLTAFADLVELDIFVQNTDLTKPVVFPLYPCGQDTTCPNFLPEGFMMTVEVDTVPAYRARIVDDRGWGVTTALDDPSGSYTMQFEVDAEYFYGDNVQTPEFRGRKYFLELMPAAGASPGTLSGAIRVSAEVPAP